MRLDRRAQQDEEEHLASRQLHHSVSNADSYAMYLRATRELRQQHVQCYGHSDTDESDTEEAWRVRAIPSDSTHDDSDYAGMRERTNPGSLPTNTPPCAARVCPQRVQASLPHQNPGIASGQKRSMSVSRDTSTHVAQPQTPAPPHSHMHARTREQRFDLSAGRRIRNAQMLTSKSFAKDTMRIS